MYIIVKNIYIYIFDYICIYIQIFVYIYNEYMYLNVNVNVYIYMCIYIYIYIYVYIHISQPTRKFAKHTRCEQVDRDVNIPPPKPRSSRSIHDASKLAGTLSSPTPHPNRRLRVAPERCSGCDLLQVVVQPWSHLAKCWSMLPALAGLKQATKEQGVRGS